MKGKRGKRGRVREEMVRKEGEAIRRKTREVVALTELTPHMPEIAGWARREPQSAVQSGRDPTM